LWLISKVKGYELKSTKNKYLLLDQTFLNDKGKRRKPVVKVKVQGHGCGGGWGPTRAKLGTLLVPYICLHFTHAHLQVLAEVKYQQSTEPSEVMALPNPQQRMFVSKHI
jgi:hypothetical protein